MLNIIKADLFRIFKGKGIYVIIILLLVSAFLSAYSLSPLNMGLNLGSENNSSLYGLTNEEYQELYNKFMQKLTQGLFITFEGYDILPTQRFRQGMGLINRAGNIHKVGEHDA